MLAGLLAGCGGGTSYIVEPDSCAALKSRSFDDVVIDAAHLEAAANGYPMHCVVDGHTLAGRVGFQLRSPFDAKWNGRLLMQGSGGFAGQVDPALGYYRSGAGAGLLSQGFAVATTDTGHLGIQHEDTYYARFLDGSWALDNPEGEIDFAWRGMRGATIAARAVLDEFQRGRSYRTYYVGCSGGGRIGLKMAEKAPELFDGFVIGDPTWALTREMTRAHWNMTTLAALPLSAKKLELIGRTVLARCDALDGAQDGVVENPRACSFNPFEIQCAASADADDCLTQNEAIAAARIYSGPLDAANRPLGPALPFTGGEACGGLCNGSTDSGYFREGWAWWFSGGVPSNLDTRDETFRNLELNRTFGFVLADQFLRYMAYEPDRANLQWFEFDPVADIAGLNAARALYDVQRVDFSAFARSGQRVLMYSGWSDALVNPMGLIDYHDQVVQASGGAAASRDIFRLFMVPGMQHCEGGKALDDFDPVTPLIQWVEDGVAPETIRARNRWPTGFVGRERDLCVYPKVATYRGQGSVDDPASFECR